MQIAGVMESAGAPARLTTLCVYGGVPKHPQACAACPTHPTRCNLSAAVGEAPLPAGGGLYLICASGHFLRGALACTNQHSDEM